MFNMSSIAEFFCCGKELEEKQVTVFNDRRRTHSAQTRTARIQRSLGKKPREQSTEQRLCNATMLTLTCTRSAQSNHHREGSNHTHAEASFQEKISPFLQPQFQHQSQPTPTRHCVTLLSPHSPSRKYGQSGDCLQRPIRNGKAQLQCKQNIEINLELPIICVQQRRSLEWKLLRGSRGEGISVVGGGREETSVRMALPRPVLETIQERLSVPSCSESQIYEASGTPSRLAQQQLRDSSLRLLQDSSSSQNYRSCVFQKASPSSSGFKTASCDNLFEFEDRFTREHQDLQFNKTLLDVDIHQNQLHILLQEARFLHEQSSYNQARYLRTMRELEEEKGRLLAAIGQAGVGGGRRGSGEEGRR